MEPTLAQQIQGWLAAGTGVAQTVDGIVNKPKPAPVVRPATAQPMNMKLIIGVVVGVVLLIVLLPFLKRGK